MLTESSKERNLAMLLGDPCDERHGTTTGWRYGCRCEACKEAHRIDMAGRRRKDGNRGK